MPLVVAQLVERLQVETNDLILATSVTRFGAILSLRQNFKSFWLFFDGLFCIWQNFDPNWANFYDIEQIFIFANGPIQKR